MKDQYSKAYKIVEKLQSSGFCAYYAGGCVRDMLLDRTPKDIDIVTNALPDKVEALFPKTVAIGKLFGVISVIDGHSVIEVATFRTDHKYTDNRRPSKISFTDAKEDAKRRDFTINGIFYDPIKKEIIDYVRGQDDIKKKIIRFIGNPDDRIKEDHLRIIRAVRFKTILDFQYDSETFESLKKNSHLIKSVSLERIRDELDAIFKSQNRHQALIELSESNLLDEIIPEIEALKGVPQPKEYHHEGDVFTHTYLALKSLPKDTPSYIAWAVLLHDIGKPATIGNNGKRITFNDHAQLSAKIANDILVRLKFSSYTRKTIVWLVENHMRIAQIGNMRAHKKMDFILDPRFPDLIDVARADCQGTYPVNLQMITNLERELSKTKKAAAKLNNIKKKKVLINGKDLISAGFIPNGKFSIIINEANDILIDFPKMSKVQILEIIKKKYLK